MYIFLYMFADSNLTIYLHYSIGESLPTVKKRHKNLMEHFYSKILIGIRCCKFTHYVWTYVEGGGGGG